MPHKSNFAKYTEADNKTITSDKRERIRLKQRKG